MAIIEKRSHLRQHVRIPVEYEALDSGAHYSGQIANISTKGIYILSPESMDVGEKILLQMDGLMEDTHTHQKNNAFNAVVKTCRIIPKSGKYSYGIGVNLSMSLPVKDWAMRFPPTEPIPPLTGKSIGTEFNSLRKRAEDFLSRNTQAVFRLGPDNIKQLVQELYVHQIELQMQGEELRKSQDEIQVSLSQYADLYDFAPIGYLTLDSSGRIEKVNITAAALLGIERSRLIDKPLSNSILKKDQDIFWQHRRRVLESQSKQTCEIGLRNKRNEVVSVQLQSAIEPHNEGSTQKIFTAVIDITDRKKAEQQQNLLENRLAEAHKLEAIGNLAGGVAHDFNNLMMTIQGSASLMLLDLDADHPHVDLLKTIDQQVRSGSKLTGQLMAFAQGCKYDVHAVNINALIKSSVRLFARTRKDIYITTDLQDDLAAVKADVSQLEQVFLNLFINAGHAMPDGGDLEIKTCNIALTLDQTHPRGLPEGHYVQIRITDTGMGMDEATCKRIFEPFFTTKSLHQGTGLGLASAYGTVQSHSGFFEVFSRPGKGSTFEIYLPATKAKVAPAAKRRHRLSKGRGTILVVDDEARIRQVMSKMLERLGYTVMLAASGQEAIDLYRGHPNRIDLVILDMTMPGMDGNQTFDHLQALDADVRVLLASGYSLDGKAEAIVNRGCCGFIQKPYSLNSLSQALRTILTHG